MMKYETLDHNKETIILTIIRSNTYTTLVFIHNTTYKVIMSTIFKTNTREISLALENRKTMLILQQSQILRSLEFGPSLKGNYWTKGSTRIVFFFLWLIMASSSVWTSGNPNLRVVAGFNLSTFRSGHFWNRDWV